MTPVRVTRALRLPDTIRAARCRRAPDLGPTLLFFSGGTALRDLSRTLKHYTHNSVHVITPFDSGGSSARLRAVFGMPSVGDLRSRLLALADDSLHGSPEVQRLLAHRLPFAADEDSVRHQLGTMIAAHHPLVEPLPAPMRRILCTHLRVLAEHLPADFDLRGASIGNLVLAGGWLHHEGDMDSVLYLFSKLVDARGLVLPVTEESLHLAAVLEDGELVVGQHRLTGKEAAPIASPVRELFLCRDPSAPAPVTVQAPARLLRLIAAAELICFPMGSFFTSVVANLLPQGIGRAIRDAPCPKIYIPNTGQDPEQCGLALGDCVDQLLAVLRLDAGDATPTSELLDFVLVDSRNGDYPGGVDADAVTAQGIPILDMPLVSAASRPALDPELLSAILLALV